MLLEREVNGFKVLFFHSARWLVDWQLEIELVMRWLAMIWGQDTYFFPLLSSDDEFC